MPLDRPYKRIDRCAPNTAKPCGNIEVGFSSAAATVAGEGGLTLHRKCPKIPPKPGSTIQHQSSTVEHEHGLLTDEPTVRKALVQMVISLEGNFHTRQDLLQEASVCFWSRTRQFPGQRLYWYLQSVNFYLHHLRTSGRSLDSPKRCWAQAASADQCEWDDWLDTLEFNDDIMSEIQAR